MYKILLVDDKPNNNTSLELLIETYFEGHNLEDSVEVISTNHGMDAIKMVLSAKDINLIFLDLMMPKVSGMDVLEIIRLSRIEPQPHIVIVTAFDDFKTRMEARRKKENAYVIKPISKEIIEALLDYYALPHLKKELPSDEVDTEEDFFDFDDDSFDDFDIDEEQKESLNKYNQTHSKISAKEFIKNIEDLEHLIDDTEDIQHDLSVIIEKLDEENLANEISVVCEGVGKYASLLNSFIDFYELSTSLRTLERVLREIDWGETFLPSYKKKIALFIKAMFYDLVSWRDHVFIKQDAIDVYYINASALNACIQLEDVIKQSYGLKE